MIGGALWRFTRGVERAARACPRLRGHAKPLLSEKFSEAGAEGDAEHVVVVVPREAADDGGEAGEGLLHELALQPGEVVAHRGGIPAADAQKQARGEPGISRATLGGEAEDAAVVPPDRRRAGEAVREEPRLAPQRVQHEQRPERVAGNST